MTRVPAGVLAAAGPSIVDLLRRPGLPGRRHRLNTGRTGQSAGTGHLPPSSPAGLTRPV
ncbi:hypothetical protein [Amycolatopsis sp. NPDC059021]|uniref:hypothetical protein n=1 Tax=Amycolatopsis sp. NPDC059021 TaxID=3346704 RepID=UPI00366D6079